MTNPIQRHLRRRLSLLQVCMYHGMLFVSLFAPTNCFAPWFLQTKQQSDSIEAADMLYVLMFGIDILNLDGNS